ncbi:RlmE family RNA methyltransferase [Candidatus Peregrinibacteria bacterium]|nr:RlmE family RNA methyltransferase [Candidatus Peregrinibacteria bacterium]
MSRFDTQDKYFQKAKQLGYRARSVFKLEEIQTKFNLIKHGDNVLDLGAAPGSFLQYISKIVGEKGSAVGIDLQKIESFPQPNIKTYVGDIFDDKVYKEIGIRRFEVITSDLAPKTSGVAFLDGGRSLDLSLKVLDVCDKYLKKGGNALIKILPGFNEGDLVGELKKKFKSVKKCRPKAIRKTSGESYLVCMRFI